MKKMLIGILAAIVLTVGITMVDYWGTPSTGLMANPTNARTFAAEANSNTSALGINADHNDSIFSSSPILLFSLVVLGIVAFRQNSYV